MSRMVNCPNEVLVDMCHNGTWYEIIKQRNHVRIPRSRPLNLSSYIKDQPDNEWEILDRDGVNIHENCALVDEVVKMPEKVLSHPNDIYCYQQGTSNLSNLNFGVLVTSNNNDSKCLRREWTKDVIHGQNYSWKLFFERLHIGFVPPSNSLVIIDRYLFAYNSEFKTDYRNGIRNVYAILNEILPASFYDNSVDYQVLIVFDDTKVSRNITVKNIAERLNKAKSKLNRPYNITIEFLTITSEYSNDVYSETHDRIIISNYFMIHASHGFSAFQPEKGDDDKLIFGADSYASWSQRLEFESIYYGIDNEDQGTELPIKLCERRLLILKEYVSRLHGNHNGFHYLRNGNERVDISELKNRILED